MRQIRIYLWGEDTVKTIKKHWLVSYPSKAQNAALLVPHSTEKSGQEAFGFLPAFRGDPLWKLPCFCWLLMLFYEQLPFARRFSVLGLLSSGW